jgi:hypothetical protein
MFWFKKENKFELIIKIKLKNDIEINETINFKNHIDVLRAYIEVSDAFGRWIKGESKLYFFLTPKNIDFANSYCINKPYSDVIISDIYYQRKI